MLQKKIFILKKIKYAENHLILHSLSSQGERINFMARSAVKNFKNFAQGTLEPLHYLNVSYTEPRSGDLCLLKEAQIIKDFYHLRKNYKCLSLSLYFLSLTSKLTQESLHENKDLFNLLGNALKVLEDLSLEHCANGQASTPESLDRPSDKNLSQLKLHFVIKVLHQQGICPADLFKTPFLQHSIIEHPICLSFSGKEQDSNKQKAYQALKEYLPSL